MTDRAGSASRFGLKTIGPEPDGATPIEPEDLEGLIPTFVATRANLNLVEYENIAKALPWATQQAKRLGPLGVLQYAFLFALHKRMFGDVWTWAGTQRRLEANIGVTPSQITTQLKQALDDARYWHEHDVYPLDERATRIHYRLVAVHPFPNGNGRCTRQVADLYLRSVGATPFTWGSGEGGLDSQGRARKAYISALERAETDECASLTIFARS